MDNEYAVRVVTSKGTYNTFCDGTMFLCDLADEVVQFFNMPNGYEYDLSSERGASGFDFANNVIIGRTSKFLTDTDGVQVLYLNDWLPNDEDDSNEDDEDNYDDCE